jgi:anti-anti-sigma factor
MNEEIQVSVRWDEKTAIIDLVGDITTFAEKSVRQVSQSALSGGAVNMVFNFRENDYINSAGIAILIGVVTEARKHDQKLIMTGLSSHFQKIFRMVGLTQYADLYPTVDEALSALHGN